MQALVTYKNRTIEVILSGLEKYVSPALFDIIEFKDSF